MIGLFGGAFDPPHNGHVELARTAARRLGLERVVVIVAGAPGHKAVVTPAATRLALAKAAFPDGAVVLDGHARTVEMLRDHPDWQDATFLLGADEFVDFLDWQEPEEVLERVRLAVATRPGYPRRRLEEVLERLGHSERVSLFELEPMPIASRELRARLDAGEDVHEYVPAAVWAAIEADGLYGRGYTEVA